MTKLDWTKGPSEPDPGRVVDVGDSGSLSDAEIAAFRKKLGLTSTVCVQQARGIRMSFAAALRQQRKHSTLSSRIKVVELSGKADADEFIHETALLALRHAQQHRDATQALRLALAMPTGPRRGRLVDWFQAFGPLIIDTRRKRCSFRRSESKLFRPFDPASAAKTPFNGMPQYLWVDGQIIRPDGEAVVSR